MKTEMARADVNKRSQNGRGTFKSYVPFLVAAFVALIYHLRMRTMGGDDIFFGQALADQSLWAYLAGRYEVWTSRIVLEFVLVTVIQVPMLWRLIDFLMLASLPVVLSKFFDRSAVMSWCVAAAVLLYPFHDMGTAGWITTTVTHFWPLWCFFFVALQLKKVLFSEHIFLPELIAGILAGVVTGSHEQWAVVLFVVIVLCGFHLWRSKRKPDQLWVWMIFALISVVSLAVIFFCPGNAARNQVSIRDLPIFAEFGFADKLYLGLLSIERVFIANADAVFFTVLAVWTVLVYFKTDNYRKTLISALPLLILFGQTVIRTAYPGLSGLFVMPEQTVSWSWGSLSTWLPMIYLAITLFAMLYALYVLIGENMAEYVYALLMLGCGFGAGAALGFMATIYVSGERVYAVLYCALLFVTLALIGKMQNTVRQRAGGTAGKLLVTLLAIVCLVNVGFIFLSL